MKNNNRSRASNEINKVLLTRLTGVPPSYAFRSFDLDLNKSIAEIKKDIQRKYKLNPILGIQLIFKGKVLPDNLKISKIGIHPTKDVITIMAIQGGGIR
ncbi:MAG: ubiquitin-like protein [Promethearchaeota archaeon]